MPYNDTALHKTGSELFDLFVAHSCTIGEIAGMDIDTLTKQIGELRDESNDDLAWTDAAIATVILGYARPIIRKEYLDALDTYARDPCWPTQIAQERWEAFPSFEEWTLREYGLTAIEGNGITVERSK